MSGCAFGIAGIFVFPALLSSQVSFTLPPQRAARTPAIAALLHVHGWSNHSGNNRPASIAWQTQQAARAGVDLLWWTDHPEFYVGHYPDFVVAPGRPTRVSASLWTVGSWGPGGQGRAFVTSTAARTEVRQSRSDIVVTLPADTSPGADTVAMFFGRLLGRVPARAAFGLLARPLIGDPLFQFTVWRGNSTGRFPDLRVVVPLAWHPDSTEGHREVLVYRWRTGGTAGAAVRRDTAVFTRPWPTADSVAIELRPSVDAFVLPGGIDNTTDEYRLVFSAPHDSVATRLRFSFPVVSNADSGVATQMPPAVETALAAGVRYNVRVVWGMEFGAGSPVLSASPWHSGAGAGDHLPVYLPLNVDPAFMRRALGHQQNVARLEQLTVAVRADHGLYAIAHPFGTWGARPTRRPALSHAQVDSLAAFLLQHNAWGADIIEIGEWPKGEARHSLGPSEHLWLIDQLWASGSRICADGVTDSHGGRLLAEPLPGSDEQWNFVTWIAGVTRSSLTIDILHAMKDCRLSFGNPYYTRGGVWLSVVRDEVGQLVLSMDLDGVSPSARFYLVEAEINATGAAHRPIYRRYREEVHRGDRPLVGGCQPGFARLEAWDGTRPLAFSNLVTIPALPARCRR